MGKIEFPEHGTIMDPDERISPLSVIQVHRMDTHGRMHSRRRVTFLGKSIGEIVDKTDPDSAVGVSFRSGWTRRRNHAWINGNFGESRDNSVNVPRINGGAVVIDLKAGINSAIYPTKKRYKRVA